MKREEEGKGYVMREECRKEKKREGGWSDRRKRGSRREQERTKGW